MNKLIVFMILFCLSISSFSQEKSSIDGNWMIDGQIIVIQKGKAFPVSTLYFGRNGVISKEAFIVKETKEGFLIENKDTLAQNLKIIVKKEPIGLSMKIFESGQKILDQKMSPISDKTVSKTREQIHAKNKALQGLWKLKKLERKNPQTGKKITEILPEKLNSGYQTRDGKEYPVFNPKMLVLCKDHGCLIRDNGSLQGTYSLSLEGNACSLGLQQIAPDITEDVYNDYEVTFLTPNELILKNIIGFRKDDGSFVDIVELYYFERKTQDASKDCLIVNHSQRDGSGKQVEKKNSNNGHQSKSKND